jgi:hypothetical protein
MTVLESLPTTMTTTGIPTQPTLLNSTQLFSILLNSTELY